MRPYWTHRLLIAVLGTWLLVSGCAGAVAQPVTVAVPAQSSGDGGPLCSGVLDRFIGLPSGLAATRDSEGTAAMAGRWWIRSCSARRTNFGLELSLAGPGWYWVDDEQNGLRVRQQVPFSLSLTLDNRPEGQLRDGVFSLWLVPVHEPVVDLKLTESPRVERNGALGSMLGLVLPVQSMAADRISESATVALREQLRKGVTVTYDVWAGQADASLGRLGEGQKPAHPFSDEDSWVVNDRLTLARGATQVVGPLEAGDSLLDIRVERGSGVAYSAICAADMNSYYPAIAAARLREVPGRALAASGVAVGPGDHAKTLRVEGCRYYLVLSPWQDGATLAALRVRS